MSDPNGILLPKTQLSPLKTPANRPILPGILSANLNNHSLSSNINNSDIYLSNNSQNISQPEPLYAVPPAAINNPTSPNTPASPKFAPAQRGSLAPILNTSEHMQKMGKHSNSNKDDVFSSIPKLVKKISNIDILRGDHAYIQTDADLTEFFKQNNLPAAGGWGKKMMPGSKSCKNLLDELRSGESKLELHEVAGGMVMPIRVCEVLLGKVCSIETREKNIFILNTWEQLHSANSDSNNLNSNNNCLDSNFLSSRVSRNGLLSCRLNGSELPLRENLVSAAARAVENKVAWKGEADEIVASLESPLKILDPSKISELEVLDAIYKEEFSTLEMSTSFPGLTTKYKLHIVEIICDGLL